jgi:hypothetical protein
MKHLTNLRNQTVEQKSNSGRNLLRDITDDYYLYEGQRVQLITVLAGRGERIAIVENKYGEQFDVAMNTLR